MIFHIAVSGLLECLKQLKLNPWQTCSFSEKASVTLQLLSERYSCKVIFNISNIAVNVDRYYMTWLIRNLRLQIQGKNWPW